MAKKQHNPHRATVILRTILTVSFFCVSAYSQKQPIIPATAHFAENTVLPGETLINTLNCSACHDIHNGAGQAPVAAPEFKYSLSEKYSLEQLTEWIADPHDVKPGTRMPDLFGESADDLEQAKALAHFLFSLPEHPPHETLPLGNVEAGRELYHSIGCVACHAPDDEFQPELATAEADAEAVKSNSIPITLAKLWPEHALIEYLLEAPSPAMPDFKLSPQEAADLATYLQRDGGGQSFAPAKLDSGLLARGSALFISKGCAKCHGSPPGALSQSGSTLRKLIPARAEEGCLADEPNEHAPNFHLSAAQRDAIRETIYADDTAPEIESILGALNCYACHERGGIGGPEAARKPYFGFAHELALSMGDFGNIPPKLDHVGRKIQIGWIGRIFAGEAPDVRPHMSARMPVYRHDRLNTLARGLRRADQLDEPIEMDTTGLQRHQRGHYGRDLMGVNGLGCVTCHGLKGTPAMGAPSVDLTHTVERLNPGYFKELLLNPVQTQPGTLMPPLFQDRPKADQEIEQIWTYLKELDQRRLPDGLLKEGDFELKPAQAGRPIIFRTFLEGAGMQAIAVGFPEGIHAAFDAYEARWAITWKGRFLDAMSTWDDRFSPPAKPLGEDVHEFVDSGVEGAEFGGFRLDAEGVPTFLYSAGGKEYEDTIRAKDGETLMRTMKVNGNVVKEEEISW